jgi:hypothetical protein
VRATLGDDDVGVVEEPVDGGRGKALREDRVEAGGMEVRGEDQRPPLRGGIDETRLTEALDGRGVTPLEVTDG